MIRITNHNFKRIAEDCRGFFKRNAMLPVVEKILALIPFNGAFGRTDLQVAVSIFVMKMVTRASMLRNLLTHNHPQHMRQHLAPPGPVMIYVRPPQIERVRNSFGRENVRELAAAVRILV